MKEFILTRPPSANQLFTNVKGRGRVRTRRYMTWQNAAGWELKAQKPTVCHCPVRVSIEVQRTLTKKGAWSLKEGDGDNLVKAIMDLLVTHGVLLDDNATHVYGHSLDWVDDPNLEARQVRVIVRPVEQRDAA